jgi:hypothetical protein
MEFSQNVYGEGERAIHHSSSGCDVYAAKSVGAGITSKDVFEKLLLALRICHADVTRRTLGFFLPEAKSIFSVNREFS